MATKTEKSSERKNHDVIGVKICGIKTKSVRDAAIKFGADYLGFMFYKKSPRYIALQAACDLRADIPPSVQTVAVIADADDEQLSQIVQQIKPDMIQAHGQESAARLQNMRARYGCRVAKAIPVACAQDVLQARAYARAADMIVFDAKTGSDLSVAGGTGKSFDWRWLADVDISLPWMLAGGLHAGNLAEAVRISHAPCVDVSSGVESQRGKKDPRLVAEFLRAAKAL